MSTLCSEYNLKRVTIFHNTYHHFIGEGASDSDLDILLVSKQLGVDEGLLQVLCKLDNHMIDSHHDVLVSVATLPYSKSSVDTSRLTVAPKVPN